jgi:hypothetical protein
MGFLRFAWKYVSTADPDRLVIRKTLWVYLAALACLAGGVCLIWFAPGLFASEFRKEGGPDWLRCCIFGVICLLGPVAAVGLAIGLLFGDASYVFDGRSRMLTYVSAFRSCEVSLDKIQMVSIVKAGPFWRKKGTVPHQMPECYWTYTAVLMFDDGSQVPITTAFNCENDEQPKFLAMAVAKFLKLPPPREVEALAAAQAMFLKRRHVNSFSVEIQKRPELPQHVRDLADGGHRFEAIEVYRRLTGSSIPDATEAVDKYLGLVK